MIHLKKKNFTKHLEHKLFTLKQTVLACRTVRYNIVITSYVCHAVTICMVFM